MKYDLEFQAESMVWLHNIRGARFTRRLRRTVDQHGPARALELLTHPTMSDELVECHSAAIAKVANELASVTSPATRSAESDKPSAWIDQRPGQSPQWVFLRGGGV